LPAGSEADKMAAMRRVARSRLTVVAHPAAARRQPPIRAGYEHFRLERQGALVSRKTLEYYDCMVLPFLAYLDREGVQRFEYRSKGRCAVATATCRESMMQVFRPPQDRARRTGANECRIPPA
jgi:hypothetical protein